MGLLTRDIRAGRRAVAAVTAVAAVLLVLWPASEASARNRANFFGVAILETPSVTELQTMKRGGVDVVRVPVFWELVEFSPGARVWTRYDNLFAATASAGLDVLPHFHTSPSWLYSNQQRPPLARPEHLAAWSRFVADFAARYGDGGLFWTLNPTIPRRPLRDYQVWNEPNLRFFWGGKPNAKQYMRLLRATRGALRSADPRSQVITGGLFRAPRRGTGVEAVKFLNRLYRQRGARKTIDGVGLHPYAPRPPGVIDAVAAARKVMKRRKDGKGRIWVTEFGWAVGGLGLRGSPVKAKPKQQARRLKRTYRLLLKRRDLRVRRAFWFSWRDFDFDPNAKEFWIYRMGLFNLAGTPRPAWKAYARIAGGAP